MPMINLSIGFDMANEKDPAGMCVLYRDEKGESHIQNMILGKKAELIYELLTTPSAEYDIHKYGCADGGRIVRLIFGKEELNETK